MENIPVREAIGSLMYLMGMTRPDIAFAVTQVTHFVSNPGRGHWEALKQVFAYLAGTIHNGITYGGGRMNAKTPLQAYSEADLAADLIKRKSTTGMCVSFHGGLVSWGSKRQGNCIIHCWLGVLRGIWMLERRDLVQGYPCRTRNQSGSCTYPVRQ